MGATKDELNRVMPVANSSSTARNLMEAFPRTIELRLEGEESPFFLTIQQGQMSLTQNAAGQPDIVLVGDSAAFARVVRDEIDVTHPIARGELVVEKGKVSEMTLLNRVFTVAHKKR